MNIPIPHLRRFSGGDDDSDSSTSSSTVDEQTSARDGNDEEWPFAFEQVSGTTRRGKELTAKGVVAGDEQTFAGEWPRQMVEHARVNPEQATWIGYGKAGLQEAGISFGNLTQHIGVFGTTGNGKSTVLQNMLQQWAYGNYGWCFVDPKGDTSHDLVQALPEERVDDIIWIEPGSDRTQEVGFNFLEVGVDPDHPQYDAAVEAIVDDLVSLLRAERYWGARMDRIAQNMIRAMHRSSYDYTLLDMYYALLTEENRREFADRVTEERIEFIREYTQKIAELSDNSLEPLLGRFQPWVENPITRRLIAHRDSPLNITNAVEDGKLIIVRNATESSTIAEMVATAVMRRIWTAIKARKTLPKTERDPYFLVVDEFDAVVNEEADVEAMLSKARAMNMGVTVCCQQPSQLPKSVRNAVFGNCNTLLSFRPGNPSDATTIAKRFGDLSGSDLNETPPYHAWLRLTLGEDNALSDPVRIKTFAPYPPRRTSSEAERIVDESVARYGQPKPDDTELKDSLRFDVPGESRRTTGSEGSSTDLRAAMAQAVFAAGCKNDGDGMWASVERVDAELRERVESLAASELANLREQMAGDLLELQRTEGDVYVRLTSKGLASLFDTGSSASGGQDEHRLILRQAFEYFTELGFHVTLPTQDGTDKPDGIAELPIDPMDADTLTESRKNEQRLREEYPEVYAVSDGMNLAIEAETSTIKKPMQTLTNLRKAINAGRKCVFACKDGTGNHDEFGYWARRGEQILYDTSQDGTQTQIDTTTLTFVNETDSKGNRQFYNKGTHLRIEDGVYPVRPQTATSGVWKEDGDAIVFRDSEGTEHARFDGPAELATPSVDAVDAYYERHDDEFVVWTNGDKHVYGSREELEDDWTRIYEPFIPETEFERMPTEDDFIFIVFPDSDTAGVTEPQIYETGDVQSIAEIVSDEASRMSDASDSDSSARDFW